MPVFGVSCGKLHSRNFDQDIAYQDSNFVFSEPKRRPSPPSSDSGTNFSDELRRRLAEKRQTSTTSVASSSDTVSEQSHDALRKIVREELDLVRREMLDQARALIRSELRSMTYDSHI